MSISRTAPCSRCGADVTIDFEGSIPQWFAAPHYHRLKNGGYAAIHYIDWRAHHYNPLTLSVLAKSLIGDPPISLGWQDPDIELFVNRRTVHCQNCAEEILGKYHELF